ncbi:PaaI family thioesterase [Curvivirga aplysinae]|uniref:PaaI family thioesterase n=1 Tax=Curvivirga aplysinae TaxID=2529852 RepID=UPI0012BBB906|nr:PaaI family thioesterase [Curvivirga aplysinae]MTI09197.1 PaaI family thioesterase [Curvivirga aplysinae]
MEPRNPAFKTRVADSFKRQKFMSTIGAKLGTVEPGYAEIELPFDEALSQQHGFFHGGVIGTLGDNCCGYASFSLMAETDSVLTVEFKVNLMAPGQGEKLIGKGRVIKPGKTLMVSQADIYAVQNGTEKLIATTLATMMVMKNMPDTAEVSG